MTDDNIVRHTDGESHAEQDEVVDEAGEESFPASDPPSTWSGEDPRDVDAEGSDVSQASG